jgi:sulfur-oxidizing protein SoxZ
MTIEDKRVEITAQREGARVRVRMVFPIQTAAGRKRVAAGRPALATFVRTVTIERGATPVFAAQFGPNLSRRPEVSVDLEGAATGEDFTLVWIDNSGRTYRQGFSAI